jgi:quercetin dioxygenase-like cupin family protein
MAGTTKARPGGARKKAVKSPTETAKSTYARSNRLSGMRLEFLLKAEDEALRERAAGAGSGRAAKTLAKEGRLRVLLIALNRGTVLKQHHADGPVSIQCLRGNVAITAGDASNELTSGGLLVLDANVQHEVKALRDSSILTTISLPRGG